MGRVFKYDFLKLEFKDIYDDIKKLSEKEDIKDIKNNIYILVDDIIYFIYKRNKVLYDKKLSYLKRLEVLNVINILPKEIYNKFIYIIEKINNSTSEQSDNNYNIDIILDEKELFEIVVWFVVNCGEENYSLIINNLNKESAEIFNKYISKAEDTSLENEFTNINSIQSDDKSEIASKLVEQGENYYFGRGVKKNNIKAYKCFFSAAKLRNEYAEAYLGLFYDRGIAVNRNYEIAFQWYYKAAIKGNSFSQYSLGMLYFDGNGVIKDYYKSFLWLQKSAENDYLAAFYQLGRAYYNGYGTDIDKDKAFNWYKKAADGDFAAAQYALSLMYKNGEGCEVNMISAYYWVEEAAKNDYEDAFYIVGKSYLDGIYVDTNYEKAFYYLNKGYESMDTNCIESLADMYYRGLYVKRDIYKAIELYNKAIEFGEISIYFKLGKIYEEEGLINQAIKIYEEGNELGNLKCTQRLGIIYYNGDGVERNYERAMEYIEVAVAEKEPHAMYVLAIAYIRTNRFGDKTISIAKSLLKEAYNLKSPYAAEYLTCIMISELREGKDIDKNELLKYIEFGIKNGLENSIFHYGYIYEKGIGVTKDYEKAYYYYNIASEKNSINAMRKLGDWYKRGIYFKKNIDLAIKWYEKAAEQNDVESIERLIEIYELGIGDRNNDIKAIFYVFKLLEIDALKGKEKLAYYCFKGIGIEIDILKGNEIIKEIEDIDIGTANFIKGYLAEENFIDMTEEEIVKSYEDGIELGNLACYGNLANYLYKNNLYKKDKYLKSFELAMEGKNLGVNKCSYIYYKEKLKKIQKTTLVTVEELIIIKQIKKLINNGVYEAINDLILWYETRRPEDKLSYYNLMEEAYYYKIYKV